MSYSILEAYPSDSASRVFIELGQYTGEPYKTFSVYLDNYLLEFEVPSKKADGIYNFLKKFADSAKLKRFVEVYRRKTDITFYYTNEKKEQRSLIVDAFSVVQKSAYFDDDDDEYEDWRDY